MVVKIPYSNLLNHSLFYLVFSTVICSKHLHAYRFSLLLNYLLRIISCEWHYFVQGDQQCCSCCYILL